MMRSTLTALIAMLLASGCWQMHQQDSVRPHEEPALPPAPGAVAVNAAAPVTGDALINPVARTAETIEYGRLAYRRNCWACHGPMLDGQSPLGLHIATVGPSLPHLQRSLTDPEILAQSDGVLFTKIAEWSGQVDYSCPPLGATMTDDEIWQSILFVRAVADGAVAPGEPEGYTYGVRYDMGYSRENQHEYQVVDP